MHLWYIRVPHPVSVYTSFVCAAVYQPSLIREVSHFHQDQYIYLLLKVRVHNIATILNTVVVVY